MNNTQPAISIRPPSNALEARVNEYMRPFHTAACREHLIGALQQFPHSPSFPLEESAVREQVAVRLLQEVIVMGAQEQEALDACLVVCGPLEALSACSTTLQEISARNGGGKKKKKKKKGSNRDNVDSPSILETALRTIRRWLVKGVSFPPDIVEEDDDGYYNGRCWVEQISISLAHESNHRNYHFNGHEADATTIDLNNNPLLQACLENLTKLVLMLPVQIANACHSLGVQLPTWAIASRYNPRLIEGALSMALYQQECRAAEDGPCCSTAYFQKLVQRMVRNRNPDDVALGLYKYHERHFRNNLQNQEQPKALCQLLLQLHRHALSSRESAYLLRSIMISSIPRQSHATEIATTQLTELWQKHLYPYIELSCRPILVASRKVREAFVRLLVLSPSSVLSEEWPDRLLCHCVASLLANPLPPRKKRTVTKDTDADDDSDESSESSSDSSSSESTSDDEDDDDEENDDSSESSSDDSDEGTNHHTWLAKHVQEVVATWSMAVFVRQTDCRLQRHVTNFLLSGMCFLQLQHERAASSVKDGSAATPQPPLMSDLVTSILEGVTVRLESSIPTVRKDGMMVAERLAQKMGQELQFEELDQERADANDDDEVTFLNSVMTASEFPQKCYTKANSNVSASQHLRQQSGSAKRQQRQQQQQASDSEEEEEEEEDAPVETKPKSKKSKKKKEKEQRRKHRELKKQGKSDTRILDAVFGHVNKAKKKSFRRKHKMAQSYEDSYDVGYYDENGQEETVDEAGAEQRMPHYQRPPITPKEQLRRLAQREQQRQQPYHYRPQDHQSFTDSYDQSTTKLEGLPYEQEDTVVEVPAPPPQQQRYRPQNQPCSSSLRQIPHYQPHQPPHCIPPPHYQPQTQEPHHHVTFDNREYVIPEQAEDERMMQQRYWEEQLKQQRRQQQYLRQQLVHRSMDIERQRQQEKKREEQVTFNIHSPNVASNNKSLNKASDKLDFSPRKSLHRNYREQEEERKSPSRRTKSSKQPDLTILVDGVEGPEECYGNTNDYDEQEDEHEQEQEESEGDEGEGIAAFWTKEEVEMVLDDHSPGTPRRKSLSPRKMSSPCHRVESPRKGSSSPRRSTKPRNARSPRHTSTQIPEANTLPPGRDPNNKSSNILAVENKQEKAVPSLIFAMMQDGEENQTSEQTEDFENDRCRDARSRLSKEMARKMAEEKEDDESLNKLATKKLQERPMSPTSPTTSGKPPLSPRSRNKESRNHRRCSSNSIFKHPSIPSTYNPRSMSSAQSPKDAVGYRRHPHVDPAEIDARILAAAYDQESDASTSSEPSLSVYYSSSSDYSLILDGPEQAEASQRAIRQSKNPYSRAYEYMKRKKQLRRGISLEEQKEDEIPKKFRSPIVFDGRSPKRPSRRAMVIDPDADYVSDEDDEDFDEDEEYYDDEDGYTRTVTSDYSGGEEYSQNPDDFDDDDDSVWEDSGQVHLDAYDVEDDEDDLEETQRPRYLRDALELLRTPESDDHACSKQTTALKWLPHIVQGKERPADLPDLAVPLALELMRMENKFNVKDFEYQKVIAAIALAVEEPLAVGQRLILMLWEEIALMDRLDILTVLSEAAFELSGNKQLEDWQKEAAENK